MVRRALFWSFSSQIANFVVQFGTSIVLARLLSPEEMGIYGVAWSVIGIVQLVTGFSVASYVVREKELTSQTLATAFTINAALSLMLSILILLASLVAGTILGNATVPKVLQLLALTPIIGVFSFRPSVMLQRAMQLRGVSILAFFTGVISSAVTIAAAAQGQSSFSPAYGALVSGAIGAIGAIIIGREHHSFRMSTQGWRPITAFGLRLMSIGGIASAATRVSDIILGRLLGLAALGLYNRANNLNGLLFANVFGAATRVVFAKLSETQRDQARVTEVFMQGFRLIVAVMGPLNLGLAVLSRPVIHILYGDKWMGAALPFSLLMIAQFVSLSFAMNWELFVVRDEMKVQTKLELVRSVVGIVSQTIGCFFSLAAVAASSIFDAVISVLLYKNHMVRLTQSSEGTMNRLYAEATLLSATAALPSLALMVATGWDAHVSFALLALAIITGILLWAVLIVTRSHPLRDEMVLIQNKLGVRIPGLARAKA